MNPVAFSIGPFQVHWYGIIIVAGAVLAGVVAASEARRKGKDPEHVWNMLAWLLICGIIGARLYHVFSRPAGGFIGWDYYKEHPIDIIAFWKGGFKGLGIYGGVIGGLIGLFIYTRIAKLNFWEWADIAVLGLLLAQAIGRWGNFINQELYGPPTTLPWGISIDCEHRFGDFLCPPQGTVPAETRFHPTFLYESIWNLIGVGLLLFIARRFGDRLRHGDLLLIYMIYYPLGRFWVELFFRPDAWTLGKLPTASVIAIVSIVAGVVGLVYNHRFRPKPAPAVTKTSRK